MSEINIKNKSGFTKEGYYALNKVNSKKFIMIISIIELILIALTIFLWIVKPIDLKIIIVISTLIVVYPITLYFLASSTLARNYKMNSIALDGISYSYIFNEQSFHVDVTNCKRNSKAASTIDYRTIFKVVENPKFILIYVNAKHAYIVEKEKFQSEENIETVKSLLKQNNVPYKLIK